jgi:sulfite exporter TauE/SafE
MGIGVSIFLLAVGAILTFATNVRTSGINLDTVGVILMVVGVIGLLTSMMFWNSWGGFGGRREERTVIHDREVV